jgi:hypothetical protein
MNTSKKKGNASFCVPRAAIAGLLAAQATADEIAVYLILARFTDETGVFTPAGHSAMNRYTGGNKCRGGRLDSALERLTEIPGLCPHSGSLLEPIVHGANGWSMAAGIQLPHGPTERGRIQYVLPDFDEPISERVWIGAQLVDGIGTFQRPLRTLRQGGDAAARLLLQLYGLNDLHAWIGIDPVDGLRVRYDRVGEVERLPGSSELHVFERDRLVAPMARDLPRAHWPSFSRSVDFLESSGFIYECVSVVDRDDSRADTKKGTDALADDAEPVYELDQRSARGLPPEGTKRLSGFTARIAASQGHYDFDYDGNRDGIYAAIVPCGQPTNVIGVYRLRFRVANSRNGWVSGAWAGYFQRQDEARASFEQEASRCGIDPSLWPAWPRNGLATEGPAYPSIDSIDTMPLNGLNDPP